MNTIGVHYSDRAANEPAAKTIDLMIQSAIEDFEQKILLLVGLCREGGDTSDMRAKNLLLEIMSQYESLIGGE